jgi:hypothetical protein
MAVGRRLAGRRTFVPHARTAVMALYILFLGIGLFMIAVGVFNWDSFFADPESQVAEMLGGEMVVRCLWAGGGLSIVVCVVLYWTKVL